MKNIEQSVKINVSGTEIIAQFNFCAGCEFVKDCYAYDPNHPSYISPDCFETAEKLGFYDTLHTDNPF